MKNLIKAAALALALCSTAQAATAVTSSAVNFRRTPNGAVMGVIPSNTLLTVACQGNWCRTTYKNRGGYVAASLVRPLTRSAPLAGRGVVFYATCAQMRAAGAAPIRVGHPGYRTGLDADHDGWACRYDRQR
ncbi:hypothetical protein Dxin01_04156 [Deinococcus xinjiangensis]|uniref:Excalibur calcium-binding domain-containing protein n=1 Tax=Deinococcus xinjiangensis TaxID=457454 RepID=A0ABP9VHZ8_9DEIO